MGKRLEPKRNFVGMWVCNAKRSRISYFRRVDNDDDDNDEPPQEFEPRAPQKSFSIAPSRSAVNCETSSPLEMSPTINSWRERSTVVTTG